MSNDNKKYEWVSDRISQAVNESCGKVFASLKKNSVDEMDESVHTIRGNLKKIRSLLRLTRAGSKNYKKQNELFRDEANKIVPVQVAGALIDAIDLINKQYSDRLYKNAFTELRTQLEDKKKAAIEKALGEEHVFQDIEQNLEGECERLKDQFSGGISFKTIGAGIKKVYSQGKKATEKLAESPSSENLHELQKRTNYLKHQLAVIAPIWLTMIEARENELQKLSDLLIAYEGLAHLSKFLETKTDMSTTESGTYLMHTLAEGHSEQLQKHAVLLSKRLFYLKPKDFVSYIQVSWDGYNKEQSQKLIAIEKLGFE